MKSAANQIEIIEGGPLETMKRGHALSGLEIAQMVKEQIASLTGHKADTVTGMCREEDGWHVTMDLIELNRIPASTDVLGTYDVLADDEGNVITYKRTRRYCRGEGSEA